MTHCLSNCRFDKLLPAVAQVLYSRNTPPVPGAQWTGIVTQIAIEMLSSGKVDAVVCVQSDENDRFKPKPVVARSVEDIMKARGVKPVMSPNLEVLATVEALGVKRLLFIGVGCQVSVHDRLTRWVTAVLANQPA